MLLLWFRLHCFDYKCVALCCFGLFCTVSIMCCTVLFCLCFALCCSGLLWFLLHCVPLLGFVLYCFALALVCIVYVSTVLHWFVLFVFCTYCVALVVRGAVLSRDATRVNRGIYALLMFRLYFQTRISTLHLYLQYLVVFVHLSL